MCILGVMGNTFRRRADIFEHCTDLGGMPDGNRYAQIPPIYDQDTGVEIQRQMDEEGLTAQKVVVRATRFQQSPVTCFRSAGKCWKSVTEDLPTKSETDAYWARNPPSIAKM